MKNGIFFVVAVAAWAQSGLDRPRIGMMLDRNGAARPLLGLPGSTMTANPVSTGVSSFGCGAFCLLKTDSSLIAPDATVAAPAGPALFAFDSTGAFVYFAQARELARWQSGELTPVSVQVSGEIVSLRSVDGVAEFAVRSREGIRIVRDGDVAVATLPRGARSVMLLDDRVLFSTAEGLVLLGSNGSQLSFPMASARAFYQISLDYVEILAAGGIFALRITPGKEQLFELPEPGQ